MGWKRGGKNNYHAPKTCRAPHPSMIEKGGVNEQTSLTVVINVHLPVFLMGNLIKNLLVASGLLSHPITAPPCQNLCHRPFRSSPHSNHLPRVSYDICVSGSCDGMLLACYSSAGAPCWLLSTMQPHWCCVLWPATGWRIKKRGGGYGVGSKFKGQCLRKNWCSCFPSLLFGYTWSWAEILTSPLVLTKLILLLLHHFRQRKVTSVFRQLKRLCRPRCCSQVLHGLIQQWMKPCCAVCEDERSHSSIRPNRG